MSNEVKRLIQEVEESLLREGEAHGIVKGYRVYLLRQLWIRFGSQVDDEIVWRLGAAGSEQLLRWSDRVQSEATLVEVLADEPW